MEVTVFPVEGICAGCKKCANAFFDSKQNSISHNVENCDLPQNYGRAFVGPQLPETGKKCRNAYGHYSRLGKNVEKQRFLELACDLLY